MCIAMKKFIWLKGNIFYKARVLFALFLLVAAKVLNTSVPFIFKEVVDDLNAITGSWTGSELNLSDPNHTIGIETCPGGRRYKYGYPLQFLVFLKLAYILFHVLSTVHDVICTYSFAILHLQY